MDRHKSQFNSWINKIYGSYKIVSKDSIQFASLFGKFEKQTELIVFNPLWSPASFNPENIDGAIYYNEKLFSDFFAGAKQRFLLEGKLLLLFSNLVQITNLIKEHPIEKELAEGGRFSIRKTLYKKI